MKASLPSRWLALWVLLSSACAPTLEEPAVVALGQVREDWLAQDLDNVALLRRILPGVGATHALAPFLEGLGEVDDRGNDDIGCGARRVQLAVYGGYTTAWILLIVDDTGPEPVIAELRLSQSGGADDWALYAHRLEAAWGPVATRGEGRFELVFEDPDAVERLRVARERTLGAPPVADVPEQLAHALDVLTDAVHVYDVGESCYYGGFDPVGRTAIQQLADAGRLDLVRRALRGSNPEGRVYAGQALQAAGAVDESDARVIEGLRSWDDVPVSTCLGCFVTKSRAADLL